MIHVSFWQVRSGQEERLHAWLTGLNRREDEVRPTLTQEGVRHEMAFLLRFDDELIMVLATEAEDVDEALRISSASSVPFDVEARRVMEETTTRLASSELVWQLAPGGGHRSPG